MSCADGEECAGEATRVPVSHGEASAGDEYAGELGGDAIGTGREHGTEHTDNSVEAGIGIGQVFGITFIESYVQASRRGTLTCLSNKVWGYIDAGYGATELSERDRCVSGATGDIKNAGAPRKARRWTKISAPAEMVRAIWPKSPAIQEARIEDLI